MSVDSLIDRFSEHPDQIAVIGPAGPCSFAGLTAAIGRRTSELGARGVGPGTVASLAGDFSPDSIALFLALARRGAVVVPHRSAQPVGRPVHQALAQVEVDLRIDRTGEMRVERTGRAAAHELYRELRRRRHPGLVQFSSGTSGEPKAAVHDLTLLLEKFELRRPALRTVAFLQFDHLGGINTMLHTLSNGAALVPTASRAPDAVCRLIDEHEVELLPTTPSFLNLMLSSGAHRHHDLGSLRTISYGAEAMPADTLARVRAAFPGVKLQQTYGMVELGAMRTRSREDGSLWVRVGGEGFQTRIVDGTLQVRARSMLLGYLNAAMPLTADGWFVTGDRVEQDGEYVRFLGRDSDLINVGGEKVYPAEVEGAIESMEGVLEATVYGEPNRLMGEVVCARVAARASDDREFARRVKRHCRTRLERFKVPVKVEVVADEPAKERVKKSRHRRANDQPDSTWADAATWEDAELRREVFFFESGGVELYGSLYAAVEPSRPLGVIACNSWGVEGDRVDPLQRSVALAAARLGGAGLVFHYPGFGDSFGDLADVDLTDLSAAALDALAEGSQRCPRVEWTFAGFMLGASVAALACAHRRGGGLLLVQPVFKPGSYFRWLARRSRPIAPGPGTRHLAMIEAGASQQTAYGYPIPRRIADRPEDADVEVDAALAGLDGDGVVIRHTMAEGTDRAPAGFDEIVLPGSWRFGAQNYPLLEDATIEWLERRMEA